MKLLLTSRSCIAVLLLGVSLGAGAAVVVAPTGISASTSDFGGPFALINQINQSGLSAGYTSGVTDFDAFVAGTTHNGANALNSGFSVGPFGRFTYDLGGLIAINGIGLWETQNSGSVLSFDLYSDNDSDFSNGASLIGGFVATASGAAISSGQSFGFGTVSAAFVHMAINTTNGGSQPGLGEVIFRAGATVPEPMTLALVCVALAGVGLSRRRAR